MSISPTSDIADPRRVGQPLRLTPEVRLAPDAGERRDVVRTYAESGTLYDGAATGTAAGDGEEMSFWDFLDVINPLQHIPVVSTIYRELTGDQIKAPAKMAGGALFGGVIGFAASAADVILKEASGRDAGEHVMALFSDEEGAPEGAAPTALAATEPAPQPAPQPAAAPAAAERPVVTAANSRWFPINRDQHVRAGEAAPQPVPEAATTGRPTVEVLSPKPVDAQPPLQSSSPAATPSSPAASLPLGVLSAASAVSVQEQGAAMAPSPAALRKAMAAQGLTPNSDHPMLRGAAPAAAPAPEAPAATPVSAPAGLPPSTGPVDVPAWFDKAMQRYSTSDRLAPSDIPALAPVAAPAVRRGA